MGIIDSSSQSSSNNPRLNEIHSSSHRVVSFDDLCCPPSEGLLHDNQPTLDPPFSWELKNHRLHALLELLHSHLSGSTKEATPQENIEEQERRPSLVIDEHLKSIVQLTVDNQIIVLGAETGVGKSVRVPQALLDHGFKVVTTEPRVLAAMSLGIRVAHERGEPLGEVVGYRTALYRNDSPHTRLLYCTDGLQLVREIAQSGFKPDVLIIDEIHEWNVNMEVLLDWVRSDPNRKLMIMSATMDKGAISEYLGDAAFIEIPGRNYKVAERQPLDSIEEDIADLVDEHRNVLVFQPGKREIQQTIARLHRMGVDAQILPLHGELTLDEQARVFTEYDRPKVIVATNIAQTSITIPDIDAVVDSGLERRIEIHNGVEGLYLRAISKSDRKQRRGRAGRTRPGIYIDHCEVPLEQRPAHGTPEILRTHISQPLLRLLDVGIDLEERNLFHQPSPASIEAAKKSLSILGCLDVDHQLTKRGKLIAKLPCSPQCGVMLLEAGERGVLNDVISAVAILEAGGILDYELDIWDHQFAKTEKESDVIAQVRIFDGFRAVLESNPEIFTAPELQQQTFESLCEANGIRPKGLLRTLENRALLLRAFELDEDSIETTGTKEDLLKSIAAGLIEHIYHRDPESSGTYHNCRDSRELSKSSVVKKPEWVVGNPFDLQVGLLDDAIVLPLLTDVTQIQPEWLKEIAPHLLTIKAPEDPRYAIKKDSVFFAHPIYFNDYVIEQDYRPLDNHPESKRAFASWLASIMIDSEYPSQARRYEALEGVYNWNRDYQQMALRQNRQAGREVLPILKGEALVNFFLDRLNGATKVSEIKDFNQLRFG